MSTKTFVAVAGVVFFIVALLHALRLFFEWSVEIGSFRFPVYVSVAALVLASCMAYQSFKLHGKL